MRFAPSAFQRWRHPSLLLNRQEARVVKAGRRVSKRGFSIASNKVEREGSKESSGSVKVLGPNRQQHTETEVPSRDGQLTTARESGWWAALESRYKIVIAITLSFVVCNMDKVNMSVAIIPMAEDFGWSSSVSGIIQSSFFYGYLLCQLPSGIMSSQLGGRRVLPAGVGLWSLATCGVPLLASTIPGLCASRAAVGLGEAVAPSAATDIVARVVPANERSRAVAFVFSGLHVGSILGLLAAPPLISNFGWEMVFISFGMLGMFWILWFESLIAEIGRTDPEVAALLVGRSAASKAAPIPIEVETVSVLGKEAKSIPTSQLETASSSVVELREEPAGGDHHGALIDGDLPIPWRAFFRSTPVRALMFTHFANNWFHYTMLAWLPTYFTDTLSVDLMHAAQTALLPPLAGIAASAVAGPTADALVTRGLPTGVVRKLAQCTAFLVPSAFLIMACTPEIADSTVLTVASITLALGISSFSLAGLYCTHQDMSPKYAPAMLGLTNTVGAIPGIIGVSTVGWIFDETESWELALFAPSAFFMIVGAIVYTMHCRNERVDFDVSELNRPFAFEKSLPAINFPIMPPWPFNKD